MNLKNLQFAEKQVENLLKILQVGSPVKGEVAVFFDIDGTINRNDCLELLISEIVSRNLLQDSKREIFEKNINCGKAANWILKII